MVKSRTIIATPPGATVKEQIVDRGMSQKEFAARMEMSEKHISKLINGDVQLTHDVANRLEMVLGIPSKFWINLEANYREKIVKAKAENEMDEDLEILKRIPYREMAKLGWVPDTRKLNERVINLRKYFEVVSLRLLQNNQINRIACRRTAETEKSNYALMAWAQKAKLEAREIDTEPIDLKTLRTEIPNIRLMTNMDPKSFCPGLMDIFRSCGIALVFLPHIEGSFLHGATFVDKNKIVVGLTVRGKDADKFWFSLFHELAHILYGHINKSNGTTEMDEKNADEFSKDILIPKDEFNSYVENNDFSKESIVNFAEEINVAPGIVVGRLQKEGKIRYDCYNDLKKKYVLYS